MAVLASDNFNRADGALGANYGNIAIGAPSDLPVVDTNTAVRPIANGHSGAEYTAVAGPDDGYVQFRVGAITNNADGGMGVICRSSADGFFVFIVNDSLFEFATNLFVDPGYVIVDTVAVGFAVNDIGRMEFVGDQITLKKNGAVVGGPYTHAGLPDGGNCGIWYFDVDAECRLDDFEFGTLDTDVVVTAFQPDAFQHDAFQVMGAADAGAAGTWKTAVGLAEGSVKTVLGLANASIKTIDGLTNG